MLDFQRNIFVTETTKLEIVAGKILKIYKWKLISQLRKSCFSSNV